MDFGIPDSFAPQGRVYRLFARPDREWSIEDAEGVHVGTLIATDADLGDPEWFVVSDEMPEPDSYYPTWRAALTEFLAFIN